VSSEGFQIKAIDVKNDLCVISKPDHGLLPVTLAQDDELHIRDHVFTVGAPASTFPIETEGYVSLPAIDSDSWELNGKVLLSLSIYSGNSGSPVLNAAGEVVAVIVMGSPRYPSIAIATSVRHVRALLEAL
jgi:S1-C subfamily serine protease